MEVTIRTLDSQSHQFELSDEDLTVKEFKEIILPKVNIPVDKQRLIFRGKVLHDDKKLKEYGVDGCVVHLVERAPPSSSHNRSHPNVASQQSSNQNAGISNVNVGGLNATAANLNGVAQHLVDSLVSQFGAGNVSASQRERSDILRRMSTARRFLSHAEHLLRHVIQPTQPAPNHCTCNVVQHNSESTDRREHNEQSSTNNQNTAQEDSNTTENSDPDPDTSPQALSLEFSRVMHLYHHMESSLRRYTVLLDDPQTSDRSPNEDLLPDQIAEIFHDLSHAFHALSDLSFNFNSPSPQSLMCFPQMSPVRFPPPMPHVHMSTSTANRVTGAHASSTSVRTAPTGQPVNVTPSGQAIRQRTPVAVAAISTVVHIPAGSLSHLVRNAPQTSMSTLTSSSSQSAASTTTGSNTGTTFVSDHPMQNIFPPFFGNSPFPPSMAGNSTIQMGVIAGNDGASQTFNIPNVMASSQDEGSLPLGLQSIMQNIMQNMTGGAAQTVSTANTGTAVSTSATFTSSTANTIHHQTSHNTANHPSVPQTAGHPTALPCQQSHRPHPHHHHHNQDGSVVHPDMLLPCHSFHFGPTFFHGSQAPGGVQPRVVAEVSSIVIDHNGRPIATSNNAASSNSTTQAATSNPTTAGVPDMNAIPNILSGVFGNIPGNQTSQMENRVPSSDDDDTMEVDGIGSQEILRGVQQMFHTFMGGTQQTPANANPVDERETLRDFVRQNFGLTESEEEDVVTDFIDMLADNLTMQDLLGIFFGTSTDAWTRIHTPLRQLIEKHFNDNAQMSENNTKVISSRIAEYIGDTYMQVEPHITVRPEVDLSSTLRSLDICHFEKLLKLLLDDETNFARNLRDWYIEYTALSFAVLDYSVTGGADRFISSLVDTPSFQNVFQGMSPSLRQVTLQTMCSRIRAATVSRHITSTELNSVLIKPGAKTSPRENPCKGTDDVRAAKRTKKDDDNVDVSVVWEENNPGFEVTDGSGPDSPSSPEDWHSRVPSDWLVIINRDTERQRVMQPQRPYSDAYLSGLPPKRRKMMTRHAAEADRIEVGECVKTAIERADVERNHDADKLKKDIKNEDLQTMFETTFRHDIRRRLQEDEDYRPKQHPNTEEYFMKGKK